MDTVLTLYLMVALNSGIDYVGYNTSKNDQHMLAMYRMTHTAVLGGSAAYLSYRYDLKTGGKFMLNQWAFVNDLAYYGWAWVLNPSQESGFENRQTIRRVFRKESIEHSWWTPSGMVGLRSPSALYLQAYTVISFSFAF